MLAEKEKNNFTISAILEASLAAAISSIKHSAMHMCVVVLVTTS